LGNCQSLIIRPPRRGGAGGKYAVIPGGLMHFPAIGNIYRPTPCQIYFKTRFRVQVSGGGGGPKNHHQGYGFLPPPRREWGTAFSFRGNARLPRRGWRVLRKPRNGKGGCLPLRDNAAVAGLGEKASRWYQAAGRTAFGRVSGGYGR
jgi:hypothetical protein